MPRQDSELKAFLCHALSFMIYENLKWVHQAEAIFELSLRRKVRKSTEESNPEYNNIFKDWDLKKGHNYDPSRSKNRLLVSLRNSSYMKKLKSSSLSVTYRFCTSKELNDKKKRKRKKEQVMHTKKNTGPIARNKIRIALCIRMPESGNLNQAELSVFKETFIKDCPLSVSGREGGLDGNGMSFTNFPVEEEVQFGTEDRKTHLLEMEEVNKFLGEYDASYPEEKYRIEDYFPDVENTYLEQSSFETFTDLTEMPIFSS